MTMKKETLHKMVLTTAKRQGDYGNEERYFTLTESHKEIMAMKWST